MVADTGIARGNGASSPRFSLWPSDGARPSLLLEQRAGLELAQLFASPVYYGVGVPHGDGAPILLIPGFLGSDSYLAVMHGWLRRIGYRPHTSGLAINAGEVGSLAERMLRRTDAVAREAGRPVTIVGHSLGGVLGSVVARLRPDAVTHVVTLGSPMSEQPRRATHPLVAALADVLLNGRGTGEDRDQVRALERALTHSPLPEGVRLTCFYSREDPVVYWRDCIALDPHTTACEVRGTHVGLAWNAQVYGRLGRLLPQAA